MMAAPPIGPSPPRQPTLLKFVSRRQAAAALVARVVADLEQALARRGAASLAVPGGTTPGEFLALLGYRSLDWHRVTVTLTDERWVAPSHERSNTGLVARTLGCHGRPYSWFPVWRPGVPLGEAPGLLESDSASLPWPLDVVVLGMGEDGHVASLFPGDETGFAAGTARRFVAVRGPGDEPRVSLTASAIAAARRTCLMVTGERKQAMLRDLADTTLPVARVLAQCPGRVVAYAAD